MNIIGVDFGIGNDIPTYSVIRKVGSKIELIDTGAIKDFDYTKYVATKHQIIGSREDLDKFQIYISEGEVY